MTMLRTFGSASALRQASINASRRAELTAFRTSGRLSANTRACPLDSRKTSSDIGNLHSRPACAGSVDFGPSRADDIRPLLELRPDLPLEILGLAADRL